ncbi:MAG: hypothetical protein A3F83_13375 [Candidatus Glassbacteria bacterium RIFCSPLOWO2_12_FULL_58_11]|uniref:Uncharacterized protein n=1 Tax=Candidatus Glassbacteria bacterium RIFCSPLOWO2_12_FULL_58_11 TaxID=1817867 RepID=A0A1F5YLT8_9BACT|nr:MAG: hypothetical protein A3F83_13375 [Candidatus Glassbacteria bacterium RIFCSPLOWO2_12_FULL_58_11]
MAEQKDKAAARKREKKPSQEKEIAAGVAKAFSQKNLVLFIAALMVIVLGHIALGMGSITFAPVCLVLGYCILVPLAIIV